MLYLRKEIKFFFLIFVSNPLRAIRRKTIVRNKCEGNVLNASRVTCKGKKNI